MIGKEKMKPIGYLLLTTICLSSLIGCAAPSTTVVNDDNRQFEAQRNLGEAYLKEGDYTSALRELLKAEALEPNDPYLHNSLGTVYAAKERLDLAVEHYKKALSLKPDYAPARNNLGSVYLLQKDWDAAIDCLKELTGNLLYATPHFPRYNIGWAYYNKGDFAQAERYYQEALDFEPDFARALWGMGLVSLTSGKTREAIGYLEKAVQKEPQFARAHLDLGEAYLRNGQKDKALKAFQRAMDLSPNSDIGKTAKGRLNAPLVK